MYGKFKIGNKIFVKYFVKFCIVLDIYRSVCEDS